MYSHLRLAAAAAVLSVVLTAVGCGNDLVVGGMLLPTAVPTPTITAGACLGSGAGCTLDTDCCSGVCDTTLFTCL
jgi:hypothetical protein